MNPNIQADLPDALATAGATGSPARTFRRTVATLMDHASLSSRAAAVLEALGT